MSISAEQKKDDECYTSITSPLLSSSVQAFNNDTEPPRMTTAEFSWKLVWIQVRLFRQMAFPYYKESAQGRWLLSSLLCLSLATSGVAVVISYLNRLFYNALNSKESGELYSVLGKYFVALLAGAPVSALNKYQRVQLAVHWREWMTARTFSLYITNRVYYNLERNGDIDNPDQRMSEDIRSFTSYSLELGIAILTAAVDLVSFSIILWSIYPQLFGVVFLYSGVGTFLTGYLGRHLVGLNFTQLTKEANFRYLLVRLRDNCESIAFYAGEDLEGQLVGHRMSGVMDNRRRINKAERDLEFFSISYGNLVQILPVAVIAPRYFAGEITLGAVTQSIGAFNHIVKDLCIIVNQFERLSEFSAGLARLSTFYEAILQSDPQRSVDDSMLEAAPTIETPAIPEETDQHPRSSPHMSVPRISMIYFEHDHQHADNLMLSIQGLALKTPDNKRTLLHDLNLKLFTGDSLLVVGNSGAGKSSLLRAIAGLWTLGNGTIERPVHSKVYFLPQRPYCTLGSLKDQLMYPSVATSCRREIITDGDLLQTIQPPRTHNRVKEDLSDSDLLEILKKVDLNDVAKRAGDGDAMKGLEAAFDWSNMLSLGEQQRLAFARLLVNRPHLVILDEATSALDMANEDRMYSLLNDLSQQDHGGGARPLTYISVGHRPSLVAYHQLRLELKGNEGFEMT